MSIVGAFPGVGSTHEKLIPAPKNPLDKSTVVSILPKLIQETKYTIQPGVFTIQPGSIQKPSVLVVGSSSWWRKVDLDQPTLEIPVSSIQIADSIVRDYCNGLFACNMDDQMPGLFFIPGEWTSERVMKEHTGLLIAAEKKQRKWFAELVKAADVMWARTSGNPLSISDDARLGAKLLNLQTKPWLGDIQTMELVRCIACGSLRNPQFPVCATCKAVVDKDRVKELGIQFAQ